MAVCLMKKIANSCILGPKMRAVSTKWGCLPIGPKWTDFEFFQQFLVQNQNFQRGYISGKLVYYGPSRVGGLGLTHACPPVCIMKKNIFVQYGLG